MCACAHIYAHVKEKLYSVPSTLVSVDNRLDNGYKIYHIDICLTGSLQSGDAVECHRYGISRNLLSYRGRFPRIVCRDVLQDVLEKNSGKNSGKNYEKELRETERFSPVYFFGNVPSVFPGKGRLLDDFLYRPVSSRLSLPNSGTA